MQQCMHRRSEQEHRLRRLEAAQAQRSMILIPVPFHSALVFGYPPEIFHLLAIGTACVVLLSRCLWPEMWLFNDLLSLSLAHFYREGSNRLSSSWCRHQWQHMNAKHLWKMEEIPCTTGQEGWLPTRPCLVSVAQSFALRVRVHTGTPRGLRLVLYQLGSMPKGFWVLVFLWNPATNKLAVVVFLWNSATNKLAVLGDPITVSLFYTVLGNPLFHILLLGYSFRSKIYFKNWFWFTWESVFKSVFGITSDSPRIKNISN